MFIWGTLGMFVLWSGLPMMDKEIMLDLDEK